MNGAPVGATAVVLYRAVRRRRRRARAITWMVAISAALSLSPLHAQSVDGYPDSRFIEQRERFAPASGQAIELEFLIARESAAQATRVVDATRAALATLFEWFGPPPFSQLTVAGIPWRGATAPARMPGVVTTRLRWLTTARDQSTEREIIEGVTRQYWPGAANTDTTFARALIAYTAARATHHQLEGSNFATLRFFGRIVPFSLRSVLLSPPVADSRPRVLRLDEDALRFALAFLRTHRALQTLERYVGWPTMLEALSSLRASSASTYDAASLADALSEARGVDMRPLLAECFRRDAERRRSHQHRSRNPSARADACAR